MKWVLPQPKGLCSGFARRRRVPDSNSGDGKSIFDDHQATAMGDSAAFLGGARGSREELFRSTKPLPHFLSRALSLEEEEAGKKGHRMRRALSASVWERSAATNEGRKARNGVTSAFIVVFVLCDECGIFILISSFFLVVCIFEARKGDASGGCPRRE